MAEKTLEERGLLEYLNLIDGEAETAKQRTARTWEENLRLVRGEGQWKGQAPPIFQLNILGNQVERKVARVTEAKPTFSVASRLGRLRLRQHPLGQACQRRGWRHRDRRHGSSVGVYRSLRDRSVPDGEDCPLYPDRPRDEPRRDPAGVSGPWPHGRAGRAVLPLSGVARLATLWRRLGRPRSAPPRLSTDRAEPPG